MKNLKYFLGIVLLLSITSTTLLSQYSNDKIPYYLGVQSIEAKNKLQNYKEELPRKIYLPPQRPPQDKFNQKGPDRILGDNGIELINITSAVGGQTETWISVNPNNPNYIIAGSNDDRYNGRYEGYRMGVYYSTNGGKNWLQSATPRNLDYIIGEPASGGNTNVDPGFAWDSKGNAYYAYVYAQIRDDGMGDNGVFVVKSSDYGATWDEEIGVVNISLQGTANQPLNDKCFIAADANPNSPYKDRLYVAWFLSGGPNRGIVMKYSDNWNNWDDSPIRVLQNTGSFQSPIPVVGPNGELYVAWESVEGDYTTIFFQKSTNGGETWAWSSSKSVQRVRTTGTLVGYRKALADKQAMRVSSHPYMAVDQRNGNLYVVQSGKDEQSFYGIWLAKSTNGGETWSSNIRIDNNELGNDMIMPSITVDPVTGIVAVLYYSSQNDENNTGFDAYIAYSKDGENFNHVRLTPSTWYFTKADAVAHQTLESLGNYWGDYTSITSYNGKIYPLFWMPSSPTGNYWSNDAYTAIISPAPKAPTNFIATPSTENFNEITLNWIDPTQNLLFEDLKEFNIKVYRDGQEIGEANKGAQLFLDDNAINGVTYQYSIKAVTNDSFESDFVYVNATAGGALEPNKPTNIVGRPITDGVNLQWLNPDKHIDNTFLHDLDKVNIYVDGTFSTSISKDAIVPGQISSYSINLPTEKFYKIKLTALTKRGEIITESQFTEEVLCYAGAPLTDLLENFDSESSTIIPYYTNEGWGITDTIAFSLPNCITDSPHGDYKSNAYNYLILQPVVIPSSTPTLSFEHIANIHTQAGDYGVFFISDDFGTTWKDLTCFDMSMSEKFTGDLSTSEFISYHKRLDDYIGDTLYIAFRVVTSAFLERDGWYIDDIRLTDNPSSIDEIGNLERGLSLKVYPNPVSNDATLNFRMPIAETAEIKLIDIMGNEVSTITNSYFEAGDHSLPINLNQYPQGIYFCKLNVNGINVIERIVVIK